MSNDRDFDAMYRKSQKSSFSGDDQSAENEPFEHKYLQKGEYPRYENETVQPEVLDQNGRPLNKPRGVSSVTLGFVALILGITAFILIFVGMFAHFVLWINILVCLIGIGFGIAALLSRASSKALGIAGILIAIFDLLVNLICIIVTAVSSGISAIFNFVT